MRLLFLFTALLFAASCSTTQAEDDPVDESSSQNKTDTVSETPPPCARFAQGMELFTNMEWIEYCIPLPLHTYPETFTDETVKGQHIFTNSTSKEHFITVQGMERSDTSVTLKAYFLNTYTGSEEEDGKIIQTKKLADNMPCFYAWGYYSNSIHESRFLEIHWVRKTEVIKLEAFYPIADTATWRGYLASFLTVNTTCK